MEPILCGPVSLDVPLTRIDSQTNKVLRQWIGHGGDSLRFGHDSIWLTDYHKGLVWRFPFEAIQGLSKPLELTRQDPLLR